MLRAYHRRVLGLALTLGACPVEEDQARTESVGADCHALALAAARAEGCDPRLAELAAALLTAPDELRCREQVRRLLDPSPSDARIHSVYEGVLDGPPSPLTPDERARLAALPLPGILRIKPDLRPRPGLPMTTAQIGGQPIAAHADGTFLVHVAPGEHTLTISHAGQRGEVCVELTACVPLDLIAHGHQLARHERMSPGACPQPGLEEAAGDG